MAKRKTRRKKKSYNAFKMWGSWIGASLITIWMFIYYISHGNQQSLQYFFDTLYENIFFVPSGWFGILGSIVWYGATIIGFLAGWGIHSLIRRIRK